MITLVLDRAAAREKAQYEQPHARNAKGERIDVFRTPMRIPSPKQAHPTVEPFRGWTDGDPTRTRSTRSQPHAGADINRS